MLHALLSHAIRSLVEQLVYVYKLHTWLTVKLIKCGRSDQKLEGGSESVFYLYVEDSNHCPRL